MEQKTFANLQAVADLKATQVEQWLRERKADSSVIFSNQDIIDEMATLTHDNEENSLRRIRDRLESFMPAYDYQAITLLNSEGQPVLKLGDQRHQSFLHFSGSEALLRAAIESGQVQYGDFFYDEISDLTYMLYVIPLLHSVNDSSKVVGSVVLHISPAPFLFPYLQSWPVKSDSAETLLVRRNGESVLFMNALRHRQGSEMKLQFPVNSPELPAAIAIRHADTGITEGKDHCNVTVLAAYQPVAGKDWYIIAKIDREEILRPLVTLTLQISIVVLVAVSILAVLLWWYWRQQKYIYHLLLEKQQVKTDHLLQQFFNMPFIGMAIISADTQGWIRFNNNLCTILAYSHKEISEKNWQDFIHPDEQIRNSIRLMRIMRRKSENYVGSIHLLRKGGVSIFSNINISCIRRPDGEVDYFIIAIQDVTKRKADEEHIQKLANYDALTGLPNRALFADRIDYALSKAHRNDKPLAVLFIDLDRFKNINDTCGHKVGDALLVEFSKRMISIIRTEDTASRHGGDEFLLVLPDIDANGAAHVAEKLLALGAQPYKIEQYELNVTLSIGIAMYPNDGESFDMLASFADIAMYRAKQEGSDAYRFFTTEMQSHSVRIMELENSMRRALERHEFVLNYQPQISLDTGCIIGMEALLRWQHPKLGLVPPAEFIPIAEDSGQILSIGKWVLHSAVDQLRVWMASGMKPIKLAVNLSALQFRHSDLLGMVIQVLGEAGISPYLLELELTESVAMHNPQEAFTVMDSLHKKGVRLSIDDFGTGYSSLNYLKRFPIYKLKIDKSFITHLSDNSEDRAIITAVISLAKSLGVQTIAEGVETKEQLIFLRENGCNEVQGNYFSKPLPADQFEEFTYKFSISAAKLDITRPFK